MNEKNKEFSTQHSSLSIRTPAIQFKGFSGEWEESTLEEVADFNLKTELPEIFEYVDLESVVGTEMTSHRTENKTTAPSRAQRLARKGDVFYQTVRPYQKNNYLFDKLYSNYVFSTGYAQIRPYGDSYFLLTSVQCSKFVKSVLDNCTGTSYPAINSKDLANIDILYPNEKEQTKIGSYFQQLDTLITQHQRKHDKLLNVKKAMLEKMFPKKGAEVPEIRFKGFSEKWEERKFKDIVCNLSGGTSIKPEDYQEEGKRTIPKGAVNSTGVADLSGSKYITKEFFENNIVSKVSSGDLVTSLRDLVPTAPNMGRIVRIQEPQEDFLMPQGVYKILLHDKIDEYFIITYSNGDLYRKIISREKNGSTQVHIRNGEFLNIELFKPTFQEQTKIGNLFKHLDTLLSLHQTELEKLKNIKKACLEKMFV